MSAPLSFASLNLDKNQTMPLQARKKQAKKAEPVAAAAPVAAAVAPVVKEAKKEVAKKAAPAAAPKEEDESADDSPAASPKADEKEKKAPVPRTHYSGYAMVKAVLSGDSLVLAGSTVGGQETPEKLVSLTGVLAPKFGRGKNQVDEPFAWESREYLRKHVIGQQVKFTIQHTGDAGGRDYGVVTLKGVDISEQMLKAGWVKVKPSGKEGGRIHPEKEALLALEADAAERGAGMHRKGVNPKDHLRKIDWTPDAQALYAANKNTPLPAVVDQVRDGSTLRLELVHPQNPLVHSMITLYLAGVSCPRTPLPLSVLKQQHDRKLAEDSNYKGKAPTKEDKAEAFAMEAQAFTETRLLNRDVQVLLQGVDKSGNLFGSIVFAKGNISQRLLEQGLGKLVPWSAALSPDAAVLKAAEAQAKAQKVRMWANWSEDSAAAAASSGSSQQLSEFTGKVVSIASSDSVVVEDASGKEVRVWLASVRAPRLAGRGRDGKDEPYAQEAKEFLRAKLVRA